jgi:hypothetical protein
MYRAQLCTVRTSHAVPAPFKRASAYVFLNRQFNRDTEGPAKAPGLPRVNSCLIVGGICLIRPMKDKNQRLVIRFKNVKIQFIVTPGTTL